MMKHFALIAVIAATISTANASDDFKVRVGEKKIFSAGQFKGGALDNPSIAELWVLPDGRLTITGAKNGQGRLFLVDSHGKYSTASITVSGGKTEEPAPSENENAASKAHFGGKPVVGAYCGEPLNNGVANRSFNEASDLLRRERTPDAIAKLEEALRIEPTAAVLHLYLGAALAKIRDQARGAHHYETFVLSCPTDPKVAPVLEVLREFERVMPKPGAKKEIRSRVSRKQS